MMCFWFCDNHKVGFYAGPESLFDDMEMWPYISLQLSILGTFHLPAVFVVEDREIVISHFRIVVNAHATKIRLIIMVTLSRNARRQAKLKKYQVYRVY